MNRETYDNLIFGIFPLCPLPLMSRNLPRNSLGATWAVSLPSALPITNEVDDVFIGMGKGASLFENLPFLAGKFNSGIEHKVKFNPKVKKFNPKMKFSSEVLQSLLNELETPAPKLTAKGMTAEAAELDADDPLLADLKDMSVDELVDGLFDVKGLPDEE